MTKGPLHAMQILFMYIYLNKNEKVLVEKWLVTYPCASTASFFNCKEWNVATIFLLFRNERKKATVKACRMGWLFLCPRENHDSQLSYNFYFNTICRDIKIHLKGEVFALAISAVCMCMTKYRNEMKLNVCNLHLCFMSFSIIYYGIDWNGNVWICTK